MSIASLTGLDIYKQIKEMRIEERRIRQQKVSKLVDYFFGRQKTYLEYIIKNQFSQPDKMLLQLEIYNLCAEIINKISVVYEQDPKRKVVYKNGFEPSESIQEKDQDLLDLVYGSLIKKINTKMPLVNQLTNLTRTVLVNPVYNERSGLFDLSIYTQNIADVVQTDNNPTEIEAVILSTFNMDTLLEINLGKYSNREAEIDSALSEERFIYWSNENHFAFDRSLNLIPINDSNSNPYGIMPFAIFRMDEVYDRFWNDVGDELINANDMVNVKLTEKNYLTKMQAFSLPIRIGGKGDLIFDPSMIIDIPASRAGEQDADFKFISPEAKIQELEDDIQKRITRALSRYGIGESNSNATQSGVSLMIKNSHLLHRWRKDIPFYRVGEKELFKVIKTIWNMHNPANKFSENCELAIDFAEPKLPTEPDIENQIHQMRVVENIESKADWIRSINPDIKSDDEAIKILKENAKINNEIALESNQNDFENMDIETETDDQENDNAE